MENYGFDFPLDDFQELACQALSQGKNVLVTAKTGSGKTVVAEYGIRRALANGGRVFYTTPIKSLSNQKFQDLSKAYPQATVGIVTGDIKFRPDAQIVIMTTEILRNKLLKTQTDTENVGLSACLSLEGLQAVVFDEVHYMSDPYRGHVWEDCLVLLDPKIQLILLSATLERPERVADWLTAKKGVPMVLVQNHKRVVPLEHCVRDQTGQLLTVMGPSGNFASGVYADWLRARAKTDLEQQKFRRQVRDAKAAGESLPATAVKPTVHSFEHVMNETIRELSAAGQLPALMFAFSRKECERLARKVSTDLLTSSETADVEHIVDFHLSRHRPQLEKMHQYHEIRDLLRKGIAYHHSGLFGLLKEVVEILFARGLVRVLFCTETFAVGINMPAKTAVFLSLEKYDETLDRERVLRTDEYLQMAGRAGRRGKDVKGTVIYLPKYAPLDPVTMDRLLTGAMASFESRLAFSPEFLLKCMHGGGRWFEDHVEKSFFYEQLQAEQKALQDAKRPVSLAPAMLAALDEKAQLKQALNAATSPNDRKQAQAKLEAWKNKHIGPAWIRAEADYAQHKANELLERKQQSLPSQRIWDPISRVANLLYDLDFIKCIPDDLTDLSAEHLTWMGWLATEVNEADCLLFTMAYVDKLFDGLSPAHLVALLAAFMDGKKDAPVVPPPETLSERYVRLQELYSDLLAAHARQGLYLDLPPLDGMNLPPLNSIYMAMALDWMNGVGAAELCNAHGEFPGNLYRTLQTLRNMLDELHSVATLDNHTALLDVIVQAQQALVRDIAIGDSLYLRL